MKKVVSNFLTQNIYMEMEIFNVVNRLLFLVYFFKRETIANKFYKFYKPAKISFICFYILFSTLSLLNVRIIVFILEIKLLYKKNCDICRFSSSHKSSVYPIIGCRNIVSLYYSFFCVLIENNEKQKQRHRRVAV